MDISSSISKYVQMYDDDDEALQNKNSWELA